MNVNQDIERLKFTITNQNRPNANDAKALNGIIDWVTRQREENLKSGHLFGKMFLHVYASQLQSTSGNYQLALDRCADILKMPLESVYVDFHESLNDVHRGNILDFWKENKHDKGLEEAAVKSLEENWSIEQTTDRLNELIGDMINLYQNA